VFFVCYIICVLCEFAIFIMFFIQAKYTFGDDSLHVKGLNQGHWVDVSIPYNLIFSISVFTNRLRARFVQTTYWNGANIDRLAVRSPQNEQRFIQQLVSARQKIDYSQIIDPDYVVNSEVGVFIPARECAYVTDSQLNPEQTIALFDDGMRIILLEDCQLWVKETSPLGDIIRLNGHTSQGDVMVSCPFLFLRHLDYANLEQALLDLETDAKTGKEVLRIERLAYEHFMNERSQ